MTINFEICDVFFFVVGVVACFYVSLQNGYINRIGHWWAYILYIRNSDDTSVSTKSSPDTETNPANKWLNMRECVVASLSKAANKVCDKINGLAL